MSRSIGVNIAATGIGVQRKLRNGKIGPVTLAAAAAVDPDELVNRMLWERVRFYYKISTGTQLKFLRGWLRRVLHLREAA